MFEKERESLRRQGKWVWFLLLPVLCLGSYCVCGIGVAIAIPAFNEFTHRSETTEATANLATLASSMESWCEGQSGGARGFPPSVGPVPRELRPLPQPFIAEGSFVELGFAPDSVRYRYSIDTPVSDRSSVIAEGDLDRDGVLSRFVVECRVTLGACECDDEPTTQDALE